MNANIINELGALATGARMRRLYDNLAKDAARIYAANELEFEIKYFTLFYLISKRKQIAIMDIAAELSLTHPAIIHLAKELEKKGYIESVKSPDDNRKRMLQLSAKGKKSLPAFEKVWKKMSLLNEQLFRQQHQLLQTLEALEQELEEKSYYKRFQDL
ncbi:MarR family winged helix-turn-helix transcriptional regulator [Chitinophaga nivalis]|uniref:MarR family transcriptional regulator n=1 Tax=Chitinophaga nivalis TaxID=2991709 RepID=A0ABT3IP93_9BACT|nr:MarR family transcriptional regulator [Chitinophaga nivalis]MCW3464535.1 MarR family transcriptional regulator [Chitinophaga nivalis]MCW3485774.1 MarR family transcriptional regulator [Chitinophaga nivalis]